MENLTTFGTIFILATLVEAIVEHLVKPIFFPPEPTASAPKPVAGDEHGDGELITLNPATRDILLRYVSAVAGVLLCLAYSADLLALGGLQSNTPLVGELITGIVIGRGANYLHDLVSRWAPPPALDPGR